MRYLNKELTAAIEQRKPLRWEFGRYKKYYTGLMLIAHTGYAETGRVYDSAVFCTTSQQGAEEIRAILEARGIKTTGWDVALNEFRTAQRRWQRRPIV